MSIKSGAEFYLTFPNFFSTFKLMKRLIPVILLISACTYSFSGFFPRHLRKVFIPVFDNSTIRYGLEEVVTRTFIDAITKDGRLEVTSEENANLHIIGEIVGYKREPFEYDPTGKILTYKVTIEAKIRFFDKRKEENYLDEKKYTGWGLYNNDTEEEEDGIERAVRDLTDNALRSLFLKGF